MQKYIFGTFTASEETTKDGRFDRRITLLYDDDRFAIVNRNISDDTLRDRKKIIGIWSIDDIRKDKRNRDFLICSPVRVLDENEAAFSFEVWSYVTDIAHALTQPFSEDEDATYDNRMNATAMEMLQRMLKHAGITEDLHAGREKLFTKFVDGEIDLGVLFEYATTPVYSQPQTAKLIPLYDLKVGRQYHEGIVFVDENNFDTTGGVVRVEACNFSDWKNCIPKCLNIHVANGRLYLDIDTSMFDFSLPEHELCNRAGNYQNDDRYFIATPKNGEKPMKMFVCADSVPLKTYDEIMGKMGLTCKNGQYVPNDMPDWYITNKNPYTIEECKPNELIRVRFENGMEGYYPLVYLIRRYPGKCKNAYFTVMGTTAESLSIEVRTGAKPVR